MTVTSQENTRLADLSKVLKGRVITPQDADYDRARTVFYGNFESRPAFLVRAADAGDIQKVIALARDTGMELAIRGGGHSLSGYSTVDDGIVIDCREMKAIEIDPQSRTAWAEAGVTARELTAAADPHDLAIGFGDTGSVGIAGITLAGGVGFLVRKFGMTIDNLLAAEMVLADGQVVQVDAENHPDLFWAIRGGGGNFGVMTRFKYRLHPLSQVYGGVLILPATAKAVTEFLAEAERAPEELSAIVNVMTAPPMPFLPPEVHGQLIIMALMMYAGYPQDGEKVIARFRALARPIADMIRPMRYPEIFFPDDESMHPTALAQNLMMDHVDVPLAEYVLDELKNFEAPMRAVQFRVLGGAMARVPEDATAYAHRNEKIMAGVVAFYTTPEHKRKVREWVLDVSRKLSQGSSGVYVGFAGKEDADRGHDVYPSGTWERLAAIKHRYDPTNLFRHNFNVRG